jgi:hypothetical protein
MYEVICPRYETNFKGWKTIGAEADAAIAYAAYSL